MKQLYKLIVAVYCIFTSCTASIHDSRVAVYESIWAPTVGDQTAHEFSAVLVSSACDCKAQFCEITVHAAHVNALGLIGIDFRTGDPIVGINEVSLQNKQRALKVLLQFEESGNLSVLNAIAGLMRSGANQHNGSPSAEDLIKAIKIYGYICARAHKTDEGDRAAANLGDMASIHDSRVAVYESIWAPTVGDQTAHEFSAVLVSSACDCKAQFCEITVHAAHVNALGLIGIDFRTGNPIVGINEVSLQNKQRALKMLRQFEESGNLSVLNAIAGLMRSGASQHNGSPSAEDLIKAIKIYEHIYERVPFTDEGYRAAANLGDIYYVGLDLAAIYYAASGILGAQDIKNMLRKGEITQAKYDSLIQGNRE